MYTQRVMGGARPFPRPVQSEPNMEPNWVTYCLPHGKTVVLTTLKLVSFSDGDRLVTWCTCSPEDLDKVEPVLSSRSKFLAYTASSACGHLPHECEHVQVLKVWAESCRVS